MKYSHRILFNAISILVFLFSPLTQFTPPVLALGTGCSSSSPISGAYTVTVCFATPSDGSVLSGATTITGTVSVTTTVPGVQRMVFYLDNNYLLTDYETPYTFTLPTTKWVDGAHTLSAEALMRDTFVTQRTSISVTFNNGISTTPVNTNTFTPTSGRPAATGTPFIVAAGGDGASGELNAQNVSNLIASINPNLFLYLGDVYEKGSPAEFYNWYGDSTNNFSRFRPITDPTVGNHEYQNGAAPGYFDYWNNIPNYYSYNAGGWHFISLNSNAAFSPTDPLSTQYKWLQKNLASNTKACTIVYYHHPYFNIGPEGPTPQMADIWKLLAQYGVDIVINGHDHDYQRWMPLDGNGTPTSNGITEFVVGSSGHGLQTFTATDNRVAYSNDANPTAFGILLLQLNKNGANFKYVNANGDVLDSGVVPCVPNTTADTTAPNLPTGLSATASSAGQVDLNWSASSDATGVAGYTIYRDGTSIATVTGAFLTYSDKTVAPQTTYNYTIDAFDLAGNHSAQTASATVTTPQMPASLSFPVLADTYVSSAALPIAKFGAATAIRADYSPDLHSYLRFNVQGLAGKPIVQARLMLYASNNGAQGINAQAVSDNTWDELTMTYGNAPPLGNAIASSGPFLAGNWVTLDVTPYVTGEGTYSFGITTTGLTTLSFPSRESGANSAQLIIDFQPKGSDSQAPTVPGNLTAVASGSSQVNLNWAAATDNVAVSGYTIYRNGSVLTTVPWTSLSYSDTSVGPATTNSYTVDAFDQAGNHSALSSPAYVTTSAIPSSLTIKPDADTYVNAANPTAFYGAKTTLRVDASPDVHSYLRFTVPGLSGSPITRARLAVFANTAAGQGISARSETNNTWGEKTTNYNNAPPIGDILASSGKSLAGTWIMLDVTPYITGPGVYNFALTTPSASATSLASRESGANSPQLILDIQADNSTDKQAPTTPAGLSATASGPTQVDLSWTAASDNVGVAGYTIYRDGVALNAVPPTSLTYSDTTAAAATTYHYTVDAFDQAGNHSAASAPASATTQDTPPTVPARLMAVATSPTQVDLNWLASTDNIAVAGYTIYRNGATLATVPATNLTYSDTTVQVGTVYTYSVDAFDQAGNHSAASAPVPVTPPDLQAPTAPTGLTATIFSPGQVNLSWAASTDNVAVTGYTIYRDGASIGTVSGTTLVYSDKTALSNSTYSYTVDAFDLAGNHSALSNPAPATTPAMPASLTITPDADTYTNAAFPSYNYGAALVLRADPSPEIDSYLRFTVPGLGKTPITRARLLLYANSNGSLGVNAYSVADNTWGESTTNFGNAPALGNILTTSAPFTTGSWVTLDVTSYITGEGTYSFGLNTSGAAALNFASRETGANAPQLVLDLQNGGPDTQAPSIPGGLAANASSPIQVDLSWLASTDNIAVTGYTIYRDGVSIATVPGDATSFSDTTALPLTTYNYTIDAFDQAGNHSSASDPASETTPMMPASLTFAPVADTYVNAGSPTSSYGRATTLRAASSPEMDSYLRFTVQGLGGAPITRARLLVYANANGVQGVNARAVADNTWNELTVNYGNAPALGNTVASSGPFTTGNWVALDVTPYITGEGTYSIGLSSTGLSTLSFNSREAGSNTPQLILDLQNGAVDTQAPSTPGGLTAAASSPTQVDLNWTASTDNVGVTGYTIYRDSVSIATVSGTTLTYSDKTALPLTSYNYSIDAFDLAGNHSTATDPLSATTPKMSATLTFTPDADTYVNAGLPSNNFGVSTSLRAANSPEADSYLRFTIQGLGGTPITRARLLVFANSNGSQGVSARAVADNTWGELTMNFSNAPVLGNMLATSAPFTTGNWVALDVTPYLTGEGTYSFGLSTTGASSLNFASRETGTNAPQLMLDLQNGDPDTQAPTIPTGLIATVSGSSQVNLSWAASSDNTGVSGYTIYRDGTALTTVNGTTLTYNDTTVAAAHPYSYTIDAFDAAGNHSAASTAVSVTVPDTQAPTVPGGLTATVISTTRINLSWTASTDDVGVNGYTIYRNGVVLTTVIGTTLAYADKSVLPATAYVYTVDAFDKGGNHSAQTDQVTAATADPPPSVPSGLTATATSSTQVDLGWTASTDNLAVAGYTIYRDGTVLTSVAGDTLTYSDSTVVSGKTYSYSVDAFDQPGSHSAASTLVSVTVPDMQAPTAPTGLTATPSAFNQVDLTWAASTDNVAVIGYTIYRDGASIATVPGASLAYSDKSALPKSTYSYIVDAFDAAGNHSTPTSPVPATTPNMPASLTFSPDADTYVNAGSPTSNFGKSIALRASLSPDLHSYLRFTVQGLNGTPITRARLLVFANSNGSQGVSAQAVADNTWSEIAMNYGNAPTLGNTLATSAPFTTGNWVTLDVTSYVTSEGTYSFGLSTTGASSLSFSSREAGTNTPQLILDLNNGDADTQPPSTPIGLTATVSSATQVDLSWSASSDNIGVNGYTIYRDGVALTTVNATTLVYSDKSALSGHAYSYSIDAFDAAGNHSAASTAVSATTPDTQAPTVPGSLTTTAASATRINLTWTASSDNVAVNGYTIYRDGAFLTTVIGTTLAYADKSVSPATTYSYTVDAFDKAGNHSAQTAPASATTPDPPPTVPTGLTATASSPTQVDLAWLASTDNLAVAGYTVYRDGTALTTVSGSTLNYSDTTVVSGKTYSYTVDAFDQPGGHSAASTPVSVTTPDIVTPSVPTGLSATASASNKVNLAWTASTDNVAVTGYTIYRDGTALGTVSGTTLSYSDTTVSPATTYNYTIDAFDAAGNHSAQTASSPATTQAPPSTLTFNPAADTYVNSGSPTSNFGKSTSLRVSLSPDQHSYLRFVVQGLNGRSIVRARLLIFANSNGSQGINILGVADNSWGELTMNYTNAPALGSVIATSSPFTTGNWVSIDVTPYLTGEGTYSFGVTTTGTSALNLSSKESGANAPQLVIDLN